MELKIGESIKALRKQQNRTQENLAEALGITFQAVSRWEMALSYPDMELIPAIAHYFGVSIDALFGYQNDRQQKIDALLKRIEEMNRQNNGRDMCVDECIHLARKGLMEFPGHEGLMLCLTDLLYNAGYVRHGEHHLESDDGYDIYDAQRHRQYPEWQEAISLYEKLVKFLADGRQKQQAILRLTQLYAVTGEREKAMALVEALPDVSGCSDLMVLHALDGRECAEEMEKSLSKLLCVCANLICRTVMAGGSHITNTEAIRRIQRAISLMDMEYATPVALQDDLTFHEKAGMYLYLSVFLWREGEHDTAFEALDNACHAARSHDLYATPEHNRQMTQGLPSYWPCWCVPDYRDVEQEIKADPRWQQWVDRCKDMA